MKNHLGSTKALNDLIVSSLLTKYEVKSHEGQNYLKVEISQSKKYILEDYIEHHLISKFVQIQIDEPYFIIRPCLMLEYILKDWTNNGEVTAINPSDLHINTLLFWITLFAYKTEYSVVVETNLSIPLQKTLCYFFSRTIKDCEIINMDNRFHFKSFLELYLLSNSYRPYLETGELNEMLSSTEKRKLRKIIAKEKA